MIHTFEYCKEHMGDVGTVTKVRGSVAWVSGLSEAKVSEVVTFANGVHGRISAAHREMCEVMVFSNKPMSMNMEVARTGSPLKISVGDGVLGHTIDPLGHSVGEGRDRSDDSESREVEKSEGFLLKDRRKIRRFLETGVMLVDLMVPLGKGQRELILGDRKTGKTHFALQVLLSQVKRGAIGVVSLVGKRATEIKRIEKLLDQSGVRDKIVLVVSDAQSSPGEIFMTPYTAMTVAEHFRDDGKDVVVILDDLTTHAKYYREMALLSGRFPGRDSYPGDIFYIHSRLLERAGNVVIGKGRRQKEVSITCLPLGETLDSDVTGYIQTNLMSMTDGHLFFDTSLFFEGRRPAVDVFLSVTRVGRQTHDDLFRDIDQQILSTLSKYDDLKRFLRFGTELNDSAKKTIYLAEGVMEIFDETGMYAVDFHFQALLIALLWLHKTPDSVEDLLGLYKRDGKYRKMVDKVVKKSKSLDELMKFVSKRVDKFLGEGI